MGVSHVRGGLNWGNGNVSLLFGAVIFAVVTGLAIKDASLGWRRARHFR
jgi:hypothetical protein